MTRPQVLYTLASGALLMLLGAMAHAGGPDASAGKDLFARRCSGCHALDSDKGGPRLRGVLNRKAGAVTSFIYSDSLRASGIVWNEHNLDQWLENPTTVLKDTDMEFRVANADERAAIIAYLKSISK